MNRTITYLSCAGALALVALVVGLPRAKAQPPPPAPVVAPVAVPVAAPAPSGSLRMEARLSHPAVVPGQNDVFATVDVTAVDVPDSARAPVNLALVIDRSGSMAGNKLEKAKQAARQLVSELTSEDRLSIVDFGTEAEVFPGLYATGENKARMVRRIDGIWDRGGTDIAGGLRAGQAQLLASPSNFAVNRIILMSDGRPTVGLTRARDLERFTQRIRVSMVTGVTVSALGLGTDFDENLMARIADVGAGSYGYLKDASQLAGIFSRDLRQATHMVAREVTVAFTLPESVASFEVLGRRSTQAGRVMTVAMPDFSAGQSEKLVMRMTVTAAVPGTALDVSNLTLAYRDLLSNGPGAATAHLAALVTEQRDEMLARRDKAAVVQATRALSAENFRSAADALDRGDTKKAQVALEANQALFDDAAQVAGSGAFDKDVRENQAVMGAVTAAPAPAPEVQADRVKSLKVQAMRAYGLGSSAY